MGGSGVLVSLRTQTLRRKLVERFRIQDLRTGSCTALIEAQVRVFTPGADAPFHRRTKQLLRNRRSSRSASHRSTRRSWLRFSRSSHRCANAQWVCFQAALREAQVLRSSSFLHESRAIRQPSALKKGRLLLERRRWQGRRGKEPATPSTFLEVAHGAKSSPFQLPLQDRHSGEKGSPGSGGLGGA